MIKANLIVDENALSNMAFDFKKNSCEIDKLISAANSVNEELFDVVGVNDEYFYSIMINGECFGESFFSDDDPDIRDGKLALQLLVSRLVSFPAHLQCNSTGSFGLSFLEKEGIGSLLSNSLPSSINWWNDDGMSLVSNSEELKGALRKHFVVAKIEQKYFKNFSEEMFPNIYFHEPADKIKALGVSYEDYIKKIIDYFSYLNDFALEHFESDEDRLIIGFAGSKGVEISPESVNTRQNPRAIAKRDVVINGENLRCEWHAKITSTQGRIHFYARKGRPDAIFEKTGSKVVVGIMVDHLPT